MCYEEITRAQQINDLLESSEETEFDDICEVLTDYLVNLGYIVVGGEMDLREQALAMTDLVLPDPTDEDPPDDIRELLEQDLDGKDVYAILDGEGEDDLHRIADEDDDDN